MLVSDYHKYTAHRKPVHLTLETGWFAEKFSCTSNFLSFSQLICALWPGKHRQTADGAGRGLCVGANYRRGVTTFTPLHCHSPKKATYWQFLETINPTCSDLLSTGIGNAW